jgi:hypothetical protein
MDTTTDFILFLLAALAFFLGLVWSWRGTWGPNAPAAPANVWGWPLYAGLLCFTLPWLIAAAQHLN